MSNSKIPTADEFFMEYLDVDCDFMESMREQLDKCSGFNFGTITDTMIEFAKLHVQAALEAVSRKQYFIKIPMEYAEGEGCIIVDEYEKLDQWYLPDIYPLENIK